MQRTARSEMAPPPCIVHVDSEAGFSGGEVQVFLLLEGLQRLGYRVALCCPPGSRSALEAGRRGIECHLVRMRNDLDLPAIPALRHAYRAVGADLVHLHTGRANWLGGLAARWAGLPAVTSRRMDRRVKRGWRTRLIYGRLVQRAVAISPAVVDCLTAGGVPPDRVVLICDGVDPARLAPRIGRDALRAELGATSADTVLLALAALVHRKGLDVLLDALGQLAGSGLRPPVWIAGEGPERQSLVAQAERLRLSRQVKFLGSRADVGDLLAACDVFVLPSRREGLGVSALEAMAAGRPVVCSSVGGMRHSVVPERTGLLCAPGDPDTLAQALARVLGDAALRARLGVAGPGRIGEGFLAQQMVEAHRCLYCEVLEEWRARRSARRA